MMRSPHGSSRPARRGRPRPQAGFDAAWACRTSIMRPFTLCACRRLAPFALVVGVSQKVRCRRPPRPPALPFLAAGV
jgi:hypothetical protein